MYTYIYTYTCGHMLCPAAGAALAFSVPEAGLGWEDACQRGADSIRRYQCTCMLPRLKGTLYIYLANIYIYIYRYIYIYLLFGYIHGQYPWPRTYQRPGSLLILNTYIYIYIYICGAVCRQLYIYIYPHYIYSQPAAATMASGAGEYVWTWAWMPKKVWLGKMYCLIFQVLPVS